MKNKLGIVNRNNQPWYLFENGRSSYEIVKSINFKSKTITDKFEKNYAKNKKKMIIDYNKQIYIDILEFD